MKRFYLGLVLLIAAGFIFLSTASVSAKEFITIAQILENPNRYDGQIVTVRGKVGNVKQKVSRSGRPYYRFKLIFQKARITVFSTGEPNIIKGDRVVVTGKFTKERRSGRSVFYNQINASPQFGGRIIKR